MSEDFATLGIAVDTSGLVRGRDELGRLTEAGERAEKRVKRSTDNIGGEFKGLASLAAKLGAAVGAAFSIRSIGRAADTWTDLTARVGLAVGAQEDAREVMSRLEKMARRTYSSLGQTTEGWLANATALRELGMTTKQTLSFQEAMNNALVVSGARADRAASVQNALSQAMALGELRGQQLNTVIMNGGRLAELLADEMGVTVNQLRALGSEGKITGDVIQNALLGNLQLLREEADSMPATIGDAITLVGNSFLGLVGSLDEATGASGRVADAIILVADNLDLAIAGLGSLGLLVSTQYVAGVIAAQFATMGWVGALALLKSALITTGIGALVVGLGVTFALLVRLRKATGSWGETFALVSDVASEAFDRIKDAGSIMVVQVQLLFNDLEYRWTEMIGSMMVAWGRFVDSVAGSSIGGLLGLTGGAENAAAGAVGGRLDDITDAMIVLRNKSDDLTGSIGGQLKSIEAVREVMRGMADDTLDLSDVTAALNRELMGGGGVGGGGGGGLLDKLKQLNDIIGRVEDQDPRAAIEAWHAEAMAALNDANLIERGMLEEHNAYKLDIERLYQDQLMALRRQEADQTLGHYQSFFGTMAGALQSGGESMLKISKAFGVAEAIVSMWRGAAKALELPFPANLSAWATVLATGMKAVQGIKSARPGSSGGGGGAASGGGMASQAPAPPTQTVIIDAPGMDLSSFVNMINKATKEGYTVNLRQA